MKVACPSCSQRIEITDDVLEILRGQVSFSCPACGRDVPVPEAVPVPEQAPGGMVVEPLDFSRPVEGRYQVTRLLGHGGMGAVYLANDLKKSRVVALRLLPAGLTDRPGAAERFQKEGRKLVSLDHPHLAKIHDYGITEDGSPYLAMEFVDGKNIRTLRDEGQLTLPHALQLVSEVADALHHVHRKGIVHGDLKPSGILVAADGSAKVGDLGLARITGADSRPHLAPGLAEDGLVVDGFPYLAPEQESGGAVDHRTDIHALGAILYHLLTGAFPRGEWISPGGGEKLDAGLDPIVRRALQKVPEDRYQAAEELKEDLDAVRSRISEGVLPGGIPPAPLAAGPGEDPPPLWHTSAQPTSLGRHSPILMSLEKGLAGPDESRSATGRRKKRALMVTVLLGLLAIGGIAAYLVWGSGNGGMWKRVAGAGATDAADPALIAPATPRDTDVADVAGPAEEATLSPPPLAREEPSAEEGPRSPGNDTQPPRKEATKDTPGVRMGGIGVLLAADGALPRMILVVEAGPAGRAGLRAGVEVAEVNGISMAGKPVGEVVKLLGGPVGSSVEVVVAQGGEASRRLTLSREDIQHPPAGSLVAARDGILWLKPVSYDRGMSEELRLLIENHPETKGIALDLRGIRGGVSDPLAEVAGLFLRENSVLWYLGGTDGKVSAWRRGTDAPITLPLALWVDSGTSHGGELLAWALQSNKRAKVLGAPTAGARAYLREMVTANNGTLAMMDRGVYLMNETGSVTRVVPDISLETGGTPENFAKAAFGNSFPAEPSSATASPLVADTLETWTRADGQDIVARFRRITGDSLVILMDGKEYSILLSSLSPASMARARELAAAMPAADNR